MHAQLVTTVRKHRHPARQWGVYAALFVAPWALIIGTLMVIVN